MKMNAKQIQCTMYPLKKPRRWHQLQKQYDVDKNIPVIFCKTFGEKTNLAVVTYAIFWKTTNKIQ